jgi:hypothetical protein
MLAKMRARSEKRGWNDAVAGLSYDGGPSRAYERGYVAGMEERRSSGASTRHLEQSLARAMRKRGR